MRGLGRICKGFGVLRDVFNTGRRTAFGVDVMKGR